MKQQISQTAFYILISCGVGCLLYALKNDSKGIELTSLAFGMCFNFWLASAKFNDAFKNKTDA
jgi:hypothetical protein